MNGKVSPSLKAFDWVIVTGRRVIPVYGRIRNNHFALRSRYFFHYCFFKPKCSSVKKGKNHFLEFNSSLAYKSI